MESIVLDAETKLQGYLDLANKIKAPVKELAIEASRIRLADSEELHHRPRVLIGLAIKAYNSFECVINDARELRPESLHHVKTMAEAYIYFQWIGTKPEEESAKLLVAEVCRSKIAWHNAVPELDPEGNVRRGLEKTLQFSISGLEDKWKQFKKAKLFHLAEETSQEMIGWYNRIYKTACEPAHISDLFEYMPPARGAFTLDPAKGVAIFRSLLALDFGLQIIFALLKAISEILELPSAEITVALKQEFDELHGRPVTPSEVTRI